MAPPFVAPKRASSMALLRVMAPTIQGGEKQYYYKDEKGLSEDLTRTGLII